MSLVFEFPDAADLANDLLSTKPHSTLHGDIGDTLEAYIAALGKVNVDGDYPFIYDPAGDPEEFGWWRIEYVEAPATVRLFLNAAEDASSSAAVFQYQGTPTAGDGVRRVLMDGTVQDDATAVFTDVSFNSQVSLTAGAGSNRNAYIQVYSDLTDSGFLAEATDAHMKVTIQGVAAQSDPLLDLQDSASASQFAVTPTTSAFFAAAGLDAASRPAVPTQVAVVSVSDFNAIRTAMIALGIWTDGD